MSLAISKLRADRLHNRARPFPRTRAIAGCSGLLERRHEVPFTAVWRVQRRCLSGTGTPHPHPHRAARRDGGRSGLLPHRWGLCSHPGLRRSGPL